MFDFSSVIVWTFTGIYVGGAVGCVIAAYIHSGARA